MRNAAPPLPGLKELLELQLTAFDHRRCLASDPLSMVRRYRDRRDREIVGVLASSLAYGRVAQILKSIESVLALIGPSPREFVEGFRAREACALFRGFRHRFNRGEDLGCLFFYLHQVYREHATLEDFFLTGAHESGPHVGPALAAYTGRMLALDHRPFYPGAALPPRAGVRFFFPSPRGGSACKRLNLFLRWMVRGPDKLDLGLWTRVSPSRLVIPLDTHIHRLARLLGLTQRAGAGWRTALEVTAALARLHPPDPLRYDFALCHMGIQELCPSRRNPEKCGACALRPACRTD